MFAYDKQLYNQLIYFPAEMLTCMDMALQELYDKYFVESEVDESTREEKEKRKKGLMVEVKNLRR